MSLLTRKWTWLVALLVPATSLAAQSDVVGWGSMVFDTRNHREFFSAISAGGSHTVALRSDGLAVCWGSNGSGQSRVEPLPSGSAYVQVSAGRSHTATLRSDGAIVCWGRNDSGQCMVPDLPPGRVYRWLVSLGPYRGG